MHRQNRAVSCSETRRHSTPAEPAMGKEGKVDVSLQWSNYSRPLPWALWAICADTEISRCSTSHEDPIE